ncbi:hypothetical protein CHLRE_16g670755v5 [Chlamydomonas reinhardtii]|uniref:Uncharacterized protein n=1 Tax=Chlamydomonas reinhardtii TaxID=3055 RepID=A0A2K3CUI4_CHLRE|nr:uncharacterized protein CHLRE_16g670755v5 [Chlamydomonas reinhardtii]PNW71943.1 hypothetical protein CHLRE_16g670755v5 [Chlamydomonas reinhardtii]
MHLVRTCNDVNRTTGRAPECRSHDDHTASEHATVGWDESRNAAHPQELDKWTTEQSTDTRS